VSSNLALDQVAASQAQKEVAINDIFGQVDAASTEFLALNLGSGNVTVTAAQARRAMLLRTTGNAVARDLTLPQLKRELTIQNGGSATLSIKRGTTTITLGAGLVTKIYLDGTANGMVASGGGGAGLADAPSDGNTYGRLNAAWAVIPAATVYTASTGLTLVGSDFRIGDAELLALMSLTSSANKLPYFTGPGAAALADFTAFGRSLLDDADATAARTTLGLAIGTNVQAYDADLAAISALASAADQVPYATGAGTWSMMTVTAAVRTLLDDTTTAAMLATLGALPTAGGTMTGDLLTNGARLAIGGVYVHVSGITPSLQVNDAGAGATMGITRWGNDAAQARVLLGKARGGANGTHGAVSIGDTVAEILFAASNGSLFTPSASIQSVVQAAPSGSGTPSRLVFLTGSSGGIGERLRIDEAGNVGMGGANTVISAARHFRLRSYTVATLPVGTATEMIYVSDGSGGRRLATHNGTNWCWADSTIVS